MLKLYKTKVSRIVLQIYKKTIELAMLSLHLLSEKALQILLSLSFSVWTKIFKGGQDISSKHYSDVNASPKL